jgi:peptidoglycan hydrolase CwlO-like protein
MGEGRGKLEGLIGELQAKKAELEKLIQEYELMLPHLSKAREALDEAGITGTGSTIKAAAPEAKPAEATAPADAEASPAQAAANAPAPAEEQSSGSAPARRSIASLVAEDESAGDEATH